MSGDWGGGSALAEEMIRLVMRAADGRGKPTLLTEAVLEALDVPSVDELLRNLYLDKIPRKKIMALVPILLRLPKRGMKLLETSSS